MDHIQESSVVVQSVTVAGTESVFGIMVVLIIVTALIPTQQQQYGSVFIMVLWAVMVTDMVIVFVVVVLVVVIAHQRDFSCMWPGVRKLLMGHEFGAKK